MNFKRFFAVLKARNLEFWRDRSSLAWNLIFPVLMVAGFALVFSNDPKAEYKIGVLQQPQLSIKPAIRCLRLNISILCLLLMKLLRLKNCVTINLI